jgi:aerobic-type carbon monoxide dehydrogenase small subunit (CoxS/CutS family)
LFSVNSSYISNATIFQILFKNHHLRVASLLPALRAQSTVASYRITLPNFSDNSTRWESSLMSYAHKWVAFRILLLLVWFLFPALVGAQTTNLVAAYGFDEGAGTSAADASGNSHPATLVGGPTWVAGHFGTALSFNGSSSYATTNFTTTLPNWTISGWVSGSAAPNGRPASGPIHRNANYQINWNQPNTAFRGAAAVSVGGSWYAASFGTLAANTWYYLAASYDGETLRAYKNGVLVTSNTAPSGPADSDPNPLTLGRHAAANQFFQGIVDNVRVYDRALSQAEIQADMNAPLGGSPPADITGPSVAITSHTNNQTVTSSPIKVSGTATDSGMGNNGISSVTVNGAAATGGTATGSATANWSRSVTLSPGANTITVVGKDASAAQNPTTVSITVNYTPPDTTGPAVAITSHTNNQTVTSSPIKVSGTATDSGLGNNGISSVTVNGVAATSGTATGSATANWSRSVTLSPGANTITVVGKDASTAQNSTTVSITVNYTTPDTTGPAVAITSHTNNQTVTSSPITVAGTATDSGVGNNGISSVTVNGVAATGGTATGSATANWTRSVTLSPGANTIMVVGKDASTAQNSTTVSITINYNPADATPPSPVTNLATGTANASSIVLSWTAPGDDGSTGTAASYDIRYASTAITDVNWASATQVTGEPAPLAVGSIQNFTVSGLSCATTYFFALKTSDEVPNTSTISNSPSQATAACADTTGPAVAITSHTNNQTVTISPITVTGTASDSGSGSNGISSVTVNGAAATGGTATGAATANWSQSVALNSGPNTITVLGRDASTNQNSTTVSITVNYNATQPTGLVAAYGFDETAGTTTSDLSGNNNNGTFGSGVTRTTQGKFGGALVFDGTNFVTIPDAVSLNLTTGMTLEAWVYPTVTPTGWRGIIIKEGIPQFSYFLYANTGGNNQAVMVNIGGEQIALGGSAAPVNTWTHLAGTYDGLTLRLYANGVQVAAQPLSGQIGIFSGPFRIGGNSVLGEYFQGRIDEVRIYDRALTQAEIQADISTPLGVNSPRIIIGQPAEGAVIAGSTVQVNYTTSGDLTGVDHAHFRLDNGQELMDIDFDGFYQFINVPAGNHVLEGWLVRADHSRIAGTEDFVSFTTTSGSDTTPPTDPTGLAATGVSTNQINLNWTASTDNVGVTAYQVERCQGAGCTGFAQISTPNGTTHSDVGLTANTSYRYRVRATDAAGNLSGYSNVASATTTSSAPPAVGLVAAYGFNEGSSNTSADMSGNNHPATLVGNPTWVAGQFGSALSFNGSSSYATTNFTTTLPNWTISGWVRSPAAPSSSAGSGPIHREANYQINWNHPDATFRGAAAVRVGGSWYAASFGTLAANTWYYLGVSYDGETLRTYRNGVLVTSNTAPSGPADSDPNPLRLGRHAAANQFFQGIVDDVRIYSRALSQAEIQSDMNTPVDGTPPPPRYHSTHRQHYEALCDERHRARALVTDELRRLMIT